KRPCNSPVSALENRPDRISDARFCCHSWVSANFVIMASPLSKLVEDRPLAIERPNNRSSSIVNAQTRRFVFGLSFFLTFFRGPGSPKGSLLHRADYAGFLSTRIEILDTNQVRLGRESSSESPTGV